MIRHTLSGLLMILLSLSLANGVRSSAVPLEIQPEAIQILQKMSDYLGSLEQFTFRADNTIDTVLLSGQQIQLNARVDIAIKRPNHFRVNRKGDNVDQEFYFNGKSLTLYGKAVNYYANMNVSEAVDINTGLDLAKEEVGVLVPASDLVYQDAYQVLMEDVESGMVIGTSIIGEVEVHHLAFRGSEVDWQIWVEKGDRPLPRKFLITSKWVAGAPQFNAVFSDWNTSAKLDGKMFNFSPPPEAVEIGFIPLRSSLGSSRGGVK